MKQEKTSVEISSLEYLAMKYYEADISDEEIRKNNVGPQVWNEIDLILTKKKELLNLAVQGSVSSGKSTLAMLITWHGNKLLGRKMDLKYIAADQYEFGRKTLEDYEKVVIMVDEVSALEQTGWNSTVEEKYLEQFSDVQAQRFIHRVSCAPNQILDKNATIILRVLSKDMQKKTTTCLVFYRLFSPTGERIQLVGHMTFDVSEVIKQEWHERYRTRKFKKMELIYKKGIFRMRDMHFAKVVLTAYNSLEIFTRVMKPTRDIVEGKIKRELQIAKIPITSLAIEHIKSEVASLIGQKVGAETFYKQLQKKRLGPTDKELILKGYKDCIQELKQDVDRYKELVKINEEYENI